MELFVAWFVFSGLAAWIAESKGHGAGRVFLLSVLLSPLVGMIVALVLPRKRPDDPTPESHVRCPDCRELVRCDARKCKHCGSALVPQEVPGVMAGEKAKGAVPSSSAPSDAQLMDQYGITFDGRQYAYRDFRYDRLGDAVSYARKECGLE